MASVSLVSSPPAPLLDKNMTDCELAGEEREDGELEDGEIDDEGIGIEEENKENPEVNEEKEREKEREREKEKGKEREEKSHRHSRKRYKKTRDKRRSKRRRRDRQKHHSPSSSSSSDSYDSDYDRPKNRRSQGSDGPSSQHSKGGHGNSQKSPLHKSSDFDKYSDYSDDKYDYEEEEDDYDEEMEYQQSKDSSSGGGRGRHPKEQMNRGSMRGMKQQQFGLRGRGRGGGPGRGRGMLNKNKKLKGKPWGGRGRGRGDQGLEEMEGKPSGFQKKRPIMSKEFINQHTVEHNGRYICKYFLEGRCIKGEQCKFEHELVVPDKKKELCKFYLQGYCSKGDNCIYMHNEYPCKFFHTGAKCYQGDNCKFSHETLTEVTQELLDKIINTEEENAREDELELEDLRKQGISPLPKPPPGVGLLPTPGQSSPPDGSGKKIPSLFEIKVQPTVDLVHKIALGGATYPQGEADAAGQFAGGSEDLQGGGLAPAGSSAASGPSADSSGPLALPSGPAMPQSPPGQHPPLGFPPIPPGPPPPFLGNRAPMQRPPFPQVPDLQMLQSLLSFPSVGQNPLQGQAAAQQGVDPSVAFVQTLQQQIGADSQFQSLPPPVQKAIILHLTQQQQEAQAHGGEPQGADGPEDGSSHRDEPTGWYSSDEEGGGCVSSILKTLKQQSELLQAAPPPPALGDPRLAKDRAPPSDPRMKADPRQRPPEGKKDPDGASDPRISRDPRKTRPMEPSSYRQPVLAASQKAPAGGEEEDEGERELRDRAVLIPLEAGAALRDPRCQLKQFSHIRVDILLQRPAFAQTVVWAPEDLIPSLVPKQEHSINLPLPPLIADAQMNRSALPEHPPVSGPPPTDPRLAAARLKERMSRLPAGSLESRPPADRPVDPRQQKSLDPRLKRAGSLDSKLLGQKEPPPGGGPVDPRLQKAGPLPAAARPKAEPERLPPYAPRLASSGGGLDSPTTILGGISLYDPRTPAEPGHREPAEPPKKAGILKQPPKKEGAAPQSPPPTPPGGSEEEGRGTDPPPCTSPPPPPASPAKPPAVHNLPIQALAGLIRPQYADPRTAKPGAPGPAGAQEGAEDKEEEKEEGKEEEEEEEDGEADDRTLKDVFKTFDPTASPFCQ